MTEERKKQIEKDYADDLILAKLFVETHKNDVSYKKFISQITPIMHTLIHSDIWGFCYDFLNENYQENPDGEVVTGLAYLLEMEVF